jgi:hypothetical protein
MNWVGLIFGLTDYAQIQKWWEIVMSAYLLVSLHSQNLRNTEDKGINESTDPVVSNGASISGGTLVKAGKIS